MIDNALAVGIFRLVSASFGFIVFRMPGKAVSFLPGVLYIVLNSAFRHACGIRLRCRQQQKHGCQDNGFPFSCIWLFHILRFPFSVRAAFSVRPALFCSHLFWETWQCTIHTLLFSRILRFETRFVRFLNNRSGNRCCCCSFCTPLCS